jgi:nucleoside-diphosphate-sugar epimerase
MSTLVCFGFGYSAEHFVQMFGEKFERIVGTVRNAQRAAILNAYDSGRMKTLIFDGQQAAPELRSAVREADAVLVSVRPDGTGDPVLRVLAGELTRAANLRSVVYLSTIGVYGDCGGAWVDEATPPRPGSARSRERLAAEIAWQDLGVRPGVAVAVLRLAGIYGPGQNALVQIESGRAHRIAKPGQFFNHIHVGDIAQAIDAALALQASGVFNVADDEPTAPGDPIAFAAQLLGVATPPEIAFAEAAQTMSPMALSFWQECRRVKNDKLKRTLGVSLLYPTYREGLRALFTSANSDP